MENAEYIEVSAGVRYWEDAELNGIPDEDGKIALRKGDCWAPVINLRTGIIKDWPQGVTADVHYKVCNAGEYWLQDANGKRIAAQDGYVPDCLSPGDNGYGDYIIMKIDADGRIAKWRQPNFDMEDWTAIKEPA